MTEETQNSCPHLSRQWSKSHEDLWKPSKTKYHRLAAPSQALSREDPVSLMDHTTNSPTHLLFEKILTAYAGLPTKNEHIKMLQQAFYADG